jgi:hypothetical protein
MQVQQFTTGGYVVHKMRVPGSRCRFSAWFTDDGVLDDCERIDAKGHTYPVGILQRRALQRAFKNWQR